MKFKIKYLQLGAGRPIAFLHQSSARKLNAHIGDKIEISHNGKKIIAVIDIVKGILNENEISLSDDIFKSYKIKDNDWVDVHLALEPLSTIYIAKKLKGKILSKNEIFTIIKDIVNNYLTEAEIAYFVSGVYENGMSIQETIYLTEAMYKIGKHISWHTKEIADKHSIGGVAGNRTTPIVVSICACVGITMPKTSSRAITSAAGTADVMETITSVDLAVSDLKKIVKKTGACLAWGGSLGLAPADDKLIRVERLLHLDPESQLIASILSKKLAAGSKHVLIDIPYGEGTKVSLSQGKKLKEKFIKIGKHFGLNLFIVLTLGDQPIGNGIGPLLEIKDVLKVLRRENPPKDLENKSVFLAGKIFEIMKKAKKGKGESMAREILESGKARIKFEEIISSQGKKNQDLGFAKHSRDVKAIRSGTIKKIDNNLINTVARILGCPVDKAAGIYLYKHKEDRVKKGENILVLYSESRKQLEEALQFYKKYNPIKIGK